MNKEDLIKIIEIEQQAREQYLKTVYDAVKEVSKTCGQLETNINHISIQLKWNNSELAHVLTRELLKQKRKECSKMPLR